MAGSWENEATPAAATAGRSDQLKAARSVLKDGGPVPDELRPVVAQLARSAAKRRWVVVVWVLLAGYWLLPGTASHSPSQQQLIGVGYLVTAVVIYVEPQRIVRAARRAGLGPVTRWGWPA